MRHRGLILGAALLLAGASFVLYCAPSEPEPVFFYSGAAIALVGLLSLVKPFAFLGIATRKLAAAAALSGTLLAAASLLWQIRFPLTPASTTQLDHTLPTYDYRCYHELVVTAPPARVAAALNATTFDDIPVFETLGRIRGFVLGGHTNHPKIASPPLLTALQHRGSGFLPLAEASDEIVLGMAGRPWANDIASRSMDAPQWRAFHEPGSIRVAFNLRYRQLDPGHTLLSTETRILAIDDDARRRMGIYWRIIAPGSGLIRRSLLRAVANRAEAP